MYLACFLVYVDGLLIDFTLPILNLIYFYCMFLLYNLLLVIFSTVCGPAYRCSCFKYLTCVCVCPTPIYTALPNFQYVTSPR